MKSSFKCASLLKWQSYRILICAIFWTTIVVGNEICETDSCKNMATNIQNYMNENANPCNGFYDYVCGNYSDKVIIRDGSVNNDSFTQIADRVSDQLRISIENDENANDEPESFKKLKTFYKICNDEEKIDGSGEGEFLKMINEFGGWPTMVGESWNSTDFDWENMIQVFRKKGYFSSAFVATDIYFDIKNNHKSTIYLGQPRFEHLDREYLVDEDPKHREAYLKYMIDVANILNAKSNQIEQDMKDVLKLEVRLAKISLSHEELRKISKNNVHMTLREMQEKYPYIQWLEYVNGYLDNHHTVNADDTVVVMGPEYFDKLNDVLMDALKMDPRGVANYLYWGVVENSVEYLSKRVRETKKEFKNVVFGTEVEEPRWKRCTDDAHANLLLAMGALYVRRYFEKSKKDHILKIIQDIRDTFENTLQQIDWMDPTTRKRALEKLKFIQPLVAYPDELLDDQKLDDYYKNLRIDSGETYLQTKLNSDLFKEEKFIERIKEPPAKSDWRIYGAAAVVNAFYNPTLNSILFPAAFLQAPYFNFDSPDYLNYAGIGFVVGHEVTHGFDDTGSQFDKDGRLTDWWEPETKVEYFTRKACIINQYNNYKVEEFNLYLNGENGQGENIADNGGIKIAYNAWSKKNLTDEPSLPGFETYSTRQMFWIAYAHSWCGKYRPEFLETVVKTDEHSPNKFRVDGPLSNMPEFSNDFGCPEGSFMNPVDKCSVW